RYTPPLSHVRTGTPSGISWRPLITGWLGGGIAALILLNILIGSAHAGVAAPAPARPATGASGHWTNLFPALRAISAVSPTEAWAISRATLTGPPSNILHWTGGTWTTAVAGQGWHFSDLAMRSPTDGWATGYSGGLDAAHPQTGLMCRIV